MALRYYICRVKTYANGWTIEAFPSGSGGWWFDIYDAHTGAEAPCQPVRYPTFRKALTAGVMVARKTPLPYSASRSGR